MFLRFFLICEVTFHVYSFLYSQQFTDCIASNHRMINELGRNWKEVAVHNVRYYNGICLEGLSKIMNNLSQYSRSPGRVLKR